MKKEDLFSVIGLADDEKLDEAISCGCNKRKGTVTIKILVVAACVALLSGTVCVFMLNKGDEKISDELSHAFNDTAKTQYLQATEDKNSGIEQYASEINELVFNKAEEQFDNYPPTTHLPANYMKYDNYFNSKIPESVWQEIMSDFDGMIGIPYDSFRRELPAGLEQKGFYTVSLQTYNEEGEETIYELSDFVFEYANPDGADVTLAMSDNEQTFTGHMYVSPKSELEKSAICGIEMTLLEYYECYEARFSYNGMNYYVLTSNLSAEELQEYLSWLVATIRTKDVNGEADAGVYAEAITAEMLTDATRDIFCGAYIDEKGVYTVLLTETNDENIAAVCDAFGIDRENTEFKKGEYTFLYLTDLQAKITEKMMAGEFPFVISSGVYESENRIKVGLADCTEHEKSKVLELDTLSGAIVFESAEMATIDLLVAEK